jgi:hypothetical protein
MEFFPAKLLCYSELTPQFAESFDANQDASVFCWLDRAKAAKFRAASGLAESRRFWVAFPGLAA